MSVILWWLAHGEVELIIKPGFLQAEVVLQVMMLSVTQRFVTIHSISIWELAIDKEMDPHYSINFQCYVRRQHSVVHFEQQSCVWNTYVKIRHCRLLKLFPVLLRNHPNRHIMYNTPCVASKRWLRKAKRLLSSLRKNDFTRKTTTLLFDILIS